MYASELCLLNKLFCHVALHKQLPGCRAADVEIRNRPKILVGMTPESLNRPQYSLVKSDGSAHSAPTSKHPQRLVSVCLGFWAGSYSPGGVYFTTQLSLIQKEYYIFCIVQQQCQIIFPESNLQHCGHNFRSVFFPERHNTNFSCDGTSTFDIWIP